jgi:hypothetical protein
MTMSHIKDVAKAIVDQHCPEWDENRRRALVEAVADALREWGDRQYNHGLADAGND